MTNQTNNKKIPTPEELQEIRDRINARDAEWAALPG